MDSLKLRRVIAVSLLFAICAGAICALSPLKTVDLRVYHAAVRSFFLESGPLYGANRELGWPMIYRYPPLFICLFRPFASLPLAAVAGIWAGLKVMLLGLVAWAWYRRHPAPSLGNGLWVSALLFLPYLVYELQIGNVQLFLVEAVCLALLTCDEHPALSGLLIGLGAAVKVWPAFVLPFLAVRGRGRWRACLYAVLAGAGWTALPGFWLGWGNLYHLFWEWFRQEQRINALLGDRWYPSQSLRGVMLRYFTFMDYSGLSDSNFPHVNFVSLPSWEVRHFWLVLAILLGLMALLWVHKCTDDAGAYSVFFCSLLIIEPNVQHLAYVTLLWPILYAGRVMADAKGPRFARWLLGFSAVFAVTEPLVPGAASQRLVQVLGGDFFGVLLPLTVALVAYTSRGMRPAPWAPRAKSEA